MTREETKKILMVIDATYPNFRIDNLLETLEAWHFFLADFSYNDISIALKMFVNTSGKGFPPSVDQLIAMAHKPAELLQISDAEAWDKVSRAIRNSTYNAQEEFEKLPAIVQKAVGSPNMLRNWAMTDNDTIESVIASNFRRAFRTIQSREAELSKMPTEARAKLQNIQRMMLEDKG